MPVFEETATATGRPAAPCALAWSPAHTLAFCSSAAVHVYTPCFGHDACVSAGVVLNRLPVVDLHDPLLASLAVEEIRSSNEYASTAITCELPVTYSAATWSPLGLGSARGSLLLTVDSTGMAEVWDVAPGGRESTSGSIRIAALASIATSKKRVAINTCASVCAQWSPLVPNRGVKRLGTSAMAIIACGLRNGNVSFYRVAHEDFSSKAPFAMVSHIASIDLEEASMTSNVKETFPTFNGAALSIGLSNWSMKYDTETDSILPSLLVAVGYGSGAVIVYDVTFSDHCNSVNSAVVVDILFRPDAIPATHVKFFNTINSYGLRDLADDNSPDAVLHGLPHTCLAVKTAEFRLQNLYISKGARLTLAQYSAAFKLSKEISLLTDSNIWHRDFKSSTDTCIGNTICDIILEGPLSALCFLLDGRVFRRITSVSACYSDELINNVLETKSADDLSNFVSMYISRRKNITVSANIVDCSAKYSSFMGEGVRAVLDVDSDDDSSMQKAPKKGKKGSDTAALKVKSELIDEDVTVSGNNVLFLGVGQSLGIFASAVSRLQRASVIIKIPSEVKSVVSVRPTSELKSLPTGIITAHFINLVRWNADNGVYLLVRPKFLLCPLQYVVVNEKSEFAETKTAAFVEVFSRLRHAVVTKGDLASWIHSEFEKDIVDADFEETLASEYLYKLSSSEPLILLQSIVALVSTLASEKFSAIATSVMACILRDAVSKINLIRTAFLLRLLTKSSEVKKRALQDKAYVSLLLANVEYAIKDMDTDYFKPMHSRFEDDKRYSGLLAFYNVTNTDSKIQLTESLRNACTSIKKILTGKLSEGHPWNTETTPIHGDVSSGFLEETCMICKSSIKFASPFVARCTKGHTLERCPVALSVLTAIQTRSCDCCGRKANDPHYLLNEYLKNGGTDKKTVKESLVLQALAYEPYCAWCASSLS